MMYSMARFTLKFMFICIYVCAFITVFFSFKNTDRRLLKKVNQLRKLLDSNILKKIQAIFELIIVLEKTS